MKTGPYKVNHIDWQEINGPLLLDRVASEDMDDCRKWLGTQANGRPVIQIDGQRWNAKRLMWMMWNQRQVPDNEVISQSCGNALCVSKKHLVANGHADAVSRGMARKQQERAS